MKDRIQYYLDRQEKLLHFYPDKPENEQYEYIDESTYGNYCMGDFDLLESKIYHHLIYNNVGESNYYSFKDSVRPGSNNLPRTKAQLEAIREVQKK
jgi:hypothetical protein